MEAATASLRRYQQSFFHDQPTNDNEKFSFDLPFFLQVDVFSFGIAMWEILTGQEPYADMHCGAIIGTYVASYFLYGPAEANLVSTVRVLSFDVFCVDKKVGL